MRAASWALGLAAVVLAALALRLWGFRQGLPLVYNADDVRATWTLRTWLTSDRVLEVPFVEDL